jgi:hypothetical protein
MKTLQEQYNLIKEGKGRKDVFMKSARRTIPKSLILSLLLIQQCKVLKKSQIISEGSIGGVVTTGTNPFINWKEFLAEEAKAEEKKPTKRKLQIWKLRGFDYKDRKKYR